jgi:hypothetical protein
MEGSLTPGNCKLKNYRLAAAGRTGTRLRAFRVAIESNSSSGVRSPQWGPQLAVAVGSQFAVVRLLDRQYESP